VAGLFADITQVWDRDVLPALRDYVAIPSVSEAFEPRWADLGHMDRAVDLRRRRAKRRRRR
jgi:hypothetical protein